MKAVDKEEKITPAADQQVQARSVCPFGWIGTCGIAKRVGMEPHKDPPFVPSLRFLAMGLLLINREVTILHGR